MMPFGLAHRVGLAVDVLTGIHVAIHVFNRIAITARVVGDVVCGGVVCGGVDFDEGSACC